MPVAISKDINATASGRVRIGNILLSGMNETISIVSITCAPASGRVSHINRSALCARLESLTKLIMNGLQE
jgi:hypothetical protein